jgi:DNA-binding transcriptional LysR family regulator
MLLSRSGIVPAAALEFCAQYPGHEVAILEGAYETLLEALTNGRALAAYPWIVPRAGSPLRRRFEELFERAPLAPPGAVIECNSMVAARELLLGSDRVTLLSARQMSREIAAGLLTALPHPHGVVTRPIGLTVRRSWYPTAAQQALIETLRRQASAAHAEPVARG